MEALSSAGIASAWTATRAAAKEQAVQVAVIKQQAQADQALVRILEDAAQASPPAAAAAPSPTRAHTASCARTCCSAW